MSTNRNLLFQIQDINRRLGGDVSLQAISQRAVQSPFQFHRSFQRLARETLKQYTMRLRLERAAGDLIATNKSILSIALSRGFMSHEVFTRAFSRQFGLSPVQYRRKRYTSTSKLARARQRDLFNAIGPCIRLYHFKNNPTSRRNVMPLLSIERKELAPMPFLFVRREASQSELSNALAECFGIVYPHCMKAGLEMAGFPLARYAVVGPLMTIEAGVPLLKPAIPEGEMQYCELPGGPTAVAVHGGPYEQLGDTHAAILRWIREQKLSVAGPHWEWYVTDPGEHPDPKDWRTHIYYPLAQ